MSLQYLKCNIWEIPFPLQKEFACLDCIFFYLIFCVQIIIIMIVAKFIIVYVLEHSGFSGSLYITPSNVFLVCQHQLHSCGHAMSSARKHSNSTGHKPADLIIHRRVIGKIDELKV